MEERRGGYDDTNCTDYWDTPGKKKWKQDAVLKVRRDALINIVIFSNGIKSETVQIISYFLYGLMTCTCYNVPAHTDASEGNYFNR